MSVPQCSISLSLKELQTYEILRVLNYLGVQDVVSAHYFITSVFRNVPMVPVDEMDYERELTENGRRCILQADQSCLGHMQYLVHKWFKPCQLLSDAFARILLASKEC